MKMNQQRGGDDRLHDLLKRAFAAHGGVALAKLRTFRETADLTGSGPFGMRAPAQQNTVLLDRQAASGRWQVGKGNKVLGIYQQTPAGVFLWTEKLKTQKLRNADAPFAYVPLTKTGIVGLLALQNTDDTLTFMEKGEIKGRRGPMIVRTQGARETLLLAGKGELTRETCQTTWSYLFAPDGTLVAERVTQTQPKRTMDWQMSYDRFEMFSGVKVPTEVSIKSNQVPSMITLKLKVTQVMVNGRIAPSEFAMP